MKIRNQLRPKGSSPLAWDLIPLWGVSYILGVHHNSARGFVTRLGLEPRDIGSASVVSLEDLSRAMLSRCVPPACVPPEARPVISPQENEHCVWSGKDTEKRNTWIVDLMTRPPDPFSPRWTPAPIKFVQRWGGRPPTTSWEHPTSRVYVSYLHANIKASEDLPGPLSPAPQPGP